MKVLADKVVVLTGASRGLGVDMARAFAERGARLALAARSGTELEAVRRELEERGTTAISVPTDVTSEGSLEKLLTRVRDELGPVDVLVNNAGVEKVWDFEATSPADLRSLIEVNVLGLTLLTRLVVPEMVERKSGHIVNIASVAGLTAVPHNAIYSATKHAVVGLSRSLRLELADHGIGVSVVCPGFVDGGMFLQWGRKAPGMAGSVSSEQVARATVGAVVRDRGEVVVTKGIGMIADWFQAIAPDLTAQIMRRTGIVAFMREQARLNAESAGER